MTEIALKPAKNIPGWLPHSETEPSSSHLHWRIIGNPLAWRPPTDVYLTEAAIIVRVEIAGMRENEFKITLKNQTLSIRGTRPDNAERRAYHQMEIRFGEFRTDIELHWPIESENIEAEYHDGFLRVTLPKAKPYSIEIQE